MEKDLKYDEIGFNAEHLSTLSKEQFQEEVKSSLKGNQAKIDELYGLMHPRLANAAAAKEDAHSEDKHKPRK